MMTLPLILAASAAAVWQYRELKKAEDARAVSESRRRVWIGQLMVGVALSWPLAAFVR